MGIEQSVIKSLQRDLSKKIKKKSELSAKKQKIENEIADLNSDINKLQETIINYNKQKI